MFNVIWELLDDTQWESDTYFGNVLEASEYLRDKALELDGQFNWIQIERYNEPESGD